ncbi:MAG: hypothetical protein ABIK73_08750 [candidate division WOR-3 bacterium]
MIKSKATFAFLLFVINVFFLVKSRAYAALKECDPDQAFWEKVENTFDVTDIRKTTQGVAASSSIDTTANFVSNRRNSQETRCIKGWAEQVVQTFPSNSIAARFARSLLDELEEICPNLISEDCSELTSNWGTVGKQAYIYKNGGRIPFQRAQGSGSLLGMANALQSVSYIEPIPSNLALKAFWNDRVKNIPFAGSALAADVNYNSEWGLVEASLDIWKLFRNLGYGLLAIGTMFIGFAIMTRKVLPPQTLVTAQYAIPRITLAVILIAFSFPIVALSVRIMWYLKDLLVNIIALSVTGSGVNSLFPVPIGTLYMLYKMNAYMMGATGWASLIILGITGALSVVFWILVQLRTILIYVKIVISGIMAPIQFAFGTIPGNERQISNWFRRLFIDAISLIAMHVYSNIIVAILLILLMSPTGNNVPGSSAKILLIVVYPLFSIWGFFQAAMMPSVISNALSQNKR